MVKRVLRVRFSTSALADAYIPMEGEFIFDLQAGTFRVGDGTTPGGRWIFENRDQFPVPHIPNTILVRNQFNTTYEALTVKEFIDFLNQEFGGTINLGDSITLVDATETHTTEITIDGNGDVFIKIDGIEKFVVRASGLLESLTTDYEDLVTAGPGNSMPNKQYVLDQLTVFVPITRTVTAGIGLSGGGDLSANITLNLDINSLPLAGEPITTADEIPFINKSAGNVQQKQNLQQVIADLGLSQGGGSSSGIIVSDTPPVGQAGAFWYHEPTDRLFAWNIDPNSSQWVNINLLGDPATIPLDFPNAPANGEFYNNGSQIYQWDSTLTAWILREGQQAVDPGTSFESSTEGTAVTELTGAFSTTGVAETEIAFFINAITDNEVPVLEFFVNGVWAPANIFFIQRAGHRNNGGQSHDEIIQASSIALCSQLDSASSGVHLAGTAKLIRRPGAYTEVVVETAWSPGDAVTTDAADFRHQHALIVDTNYPTQFRIRPTVGATLSGQASAYSMPEFSTVEGKETSGAFKPLQETTGTGVSELVIKDLDNTQPIWMIDFFVENNPTDENKVLIDFSTDNGANWSQAGDVDAWVARHFNGIDSNDFLHIGVGGNSGLGARGLASLDAFQGSQVNYSLSNEANNFCRGHLRIFAPSAETPKYGLVEMSWMGSDNRAPRTFAHIRALGSFRSKQSSGINAIRIRLEDASNFDGFLRGLALGPGSPDGQNCVNIFYSGTDDQQVVFPVPNEDIVYTDIHLLLWNIDPNAAISMEFSVDGGLSYAATAFDYLKLTQFDGGTGDGDYFSIGSGTSDTYQWKLLPESTVIEDNFYALRLRLFVPQKATEHQFGLAFHSLFDKALDGGNGSMAWGYSIGLFRDNSGPARVTHVKVHSTDGAGNGNHVPFGTFSYMIFAHSVHREEVTPPVIGATEKSNFTISADGVPVIFDPATINFKSPGLKVVTNLNDPTVVDVSLTQATAIHRKVVPLTNVNLQNLAATPIEVIAAPGAGKFIQVIAWRFRLIFGTVAIDDAIADGDLILKYAGGSTIDTMESDGLVDAGVDTQGITGNLTELIVAESGIDNTAVQISNDGTEFTVVGGGDGTAEVEILYRILDTDPQL